MRDPVPIAPQQLRSQPSAGSGIALMLVGACVMSSSCGSTDESLRLAVTPAPIPLISTYISCAGVWAYIPCHSYYLQQANWTVTVYSESDSAAGGVLEVVPVDQVTGVPPSESGTVKGDVSFAVAPHGSVDLAVGWSGHSLPDAPAFRITVRLTYTTGEQMVKSVTVPAAFPPGSGAS